MSGFGLKLGRSQGMEGYTGNMNDFSIDPANTNMIFTGDPVSIDAGGFLEETSGNGGTTPVVTPVTGVFHGCRYVDNDGSYAFRNYWDGNSGRTDIIAHVSMPPHSTFHARLTGPGTQADVGTRRGLDHAAGSAAYGDSRFTVGAVSATGPVVIQRLANFPGNLWTSAEPIVEVAMVAQQLTAADAV
jgi:hypothetical protein